MTLQKINDHVLKICKIINSRIHQWCSFANLVKTTFETNSFYVEWSKIPMRNKHVLFYLRVKAMTCYSRFKIHKKRFAELKFLAIAFRCNLHPSNPCFYSTYTCKFIFFGCIPMGDGIHHMLIYNQKENGCYIAWDIINSPTRYTHGFLQYIYVIIETIPDNH